MEKSLAAVVAGLLFIESGLVLGIIFSSFILEQRKDDLGIYGSLLLCIGSAAITASIFLVSKIKHRQVIVFHFDVILVSTALNTLGSFFFFIERLGIVGIYLTAAASGIITVACQSYIHLTCNKNQRGICLSLCSFWYLFGITLGAATTRTVYYTHDASEMNIRRRVYAWIFCVTNLIIIVVTLCARFRQHNGFYIYKEIKDPDLYTANINKYIFRNCAELIEHMKDSKPHIHIIQKNRCLLTAVLIFSDFIYCAFFMFLVAWFSINPAMKLTEGHTFSHAMLVITLGSAVGTILIYHADARQIFAICACLQLFILFIGLIVYGATKFLGLFWIPLVLCGVMYNMLKIIALEVAELQFCEVMLSLSHSVTLLSIIIIDFYFVSDLTSVYFYHTDKSILVFQLSSFAIVISMLTIIISIQAPLRRRESLMEIQYKILGVSYSDKYLQELKHRLEMKIFAT